MKNSGLIWKENLPYYEDALQEQWVFFCSNLCESRTGTQYDRTRGNVITWFNYYFKRRLQNWAVRVDRENNTRDDRNKFQKTERRSIESIFYPIAIELTFSKQLSFLQNFKPGLKPIPIGC